MHYSSSGTKCTFSRSVFDLVKVSHFLELTDPKLLRWYLSLPAEDRKLIQGMDNISVNISYSAHEQNKFMVLCFMGCEINYTVPHYLQKKEDFFSFCIDTLLLKYLDILFI